MTLTLKKIKKFQSVIWAHYHEHGRDFPWRRTKNPYRILVSEIMLQQTQTDRVVGYYKNFLQKFPSCKSLSRAPLADVLIAWQGLGYNRRARFLWELARTVSKTLRGRLPKTPEELETLPGIGSYTGRAVSVFAHNQPHVLIETNIRSVYIHYFFADETEVTDRQLLPLIEATIDRENPREWFYALMDYGSWLKKHDRSVNKKSAHYVKQAPFIGSRRQVRGLILKALALKKPLDIGSIREESGHDNAYIMSVVEDLVREQMIERVKGSVRLKR